MKILSPSEDKVIVELSEGDMRELDITYEAMDYSSIETRRVIWTVLDRAEKFLGRELDPSRKMVVEAAPKTEGGCVLFFTLLGNGKGGVSPQTLVKKRPAVFACEFDGLDALFQAAESFQRLGIKAESRLYARGGKYLLIIEPENGERRAESFFSEFAEIRFRGEIFLKSLGERWKSLAERDALKVILNG